MKTATRAGHHVLAEALRRRVLEGLVSRDHLDLRPVCAGHARFVFKWSGLQTGMIRYQPDGFVNIPGVK